MKSLGTLPIDEILQTEADDVHDIRTHASGHVGKQLGSEQ